MNPLNVRAAVAMRRLLIALIAGFVLVVAAVPGAGPARADDGTPGVDRFGACVAAQDKGRVLLLVDQSMSLRESDPAGDRTTAAQLLTKQLAAFSASSGAQLDVAVAGFSQDYDPVLGWTKLDAGSLGRVDSAVATAAGKNDGRATDYWQALEGARQTFAQGAPTGSPQPCQMLAWFTDGQLEFLTAPGVTKPYAPGLTLDDAQGTAAVAEAAKQSICRDAGLIDQLRSAGIVTVAIGLGGKREGGDTDKSDFSLLERIATGTDGTTTCGKLQASAPGDFFYADNIEDLLLAFDKLGTPGQAPLVKEAGACVRKVCDAGKHRFVLDSTVSNVTILATTSSTGLTPVLVSPDGTETKLAPRERSTTDIGGVKVGYEFPTDKSVSIQMSGASADQWTGVWSLVFVAPTDDAAKTMSSIHISSGMRPAVVDADALVLRSGGAARLGFTVLDKDGKTVDTAALPGKVSLSADLVTAGGKTVPIASNLDKSALTTPQKVDLARVKPGAATVRMRMTVTTAEAKEKGSSRPISTVLAPVSVDLPVTVAPPAGYPTVAGHVDFGTLEGTGEKTASIALTGPGCVWLKGADFTARPDGADAVTVTSTADSQQNCVTLSDGQQATLSVSLSSPASLNGNVGGVLTVVAEPKDRSAAPLEIPVAFQGSLTKPLNTASFTVTLILALILGPLIPLALLYLLKWVTARIPAHALRARQFPVAITGGNVLRDGRPFSVADTEMVSMVAGLDRPQRRVELSGATLSAKTGWSPFGAGFVAASASGMAGAAGRYGDSCGKTPDGRLPLAVHNHWVLFHDPSGPADAASILLLLGGDAGTARLAAIVAEINDHAPTVLSRLRAKTGAPAGPAPGSGAPDPFGPSGGSGSPADPFGFGSPPPPAGGNPFGPGPAGPPPGGNPFAPGAGSAPPRPPGPQGPNPFGP